MSADFRQGDVVDVEILAPGGPGRVLGCIRCILLDGLHEWDVMISPDPDVLIEAEWMLQQSDVTLDDIRVVPWVHILRNIQPEQMEVVSLELHA